MEYIFKGFREDGGLRCLDFDIVEADRSRMAFSVGADLALLRKYSIPMQELPLICRRLLEGGSFAVDQRLVLFTEALMREHAGRREALAESRKSKRAPDRTYPTRPTGGGWNRPGQ